MDGAADFDETSAMEATPSETGKGTRLLRRIGVAGFAFFLIKGLLWLLVPAALWWLRG